MIENAREMLRKASLGGYAVGAFNITNILQMEAVVEAAHNKRSPVIIQTSVSPVKFIGPEVIASAYKAIARGVDIPVCLHLDHCEDVDLCIRCADAGYTNIMIDASHNELDKNIEITKGVVDYCRDKGDITVEGELGRVLGVEDELVVDEDEARLCDPDEALEFVSKTGVDLFAPAIGTAHGVYKGEPNVDFDRFEKIAQIVNGDAYRSALVIHGGTGLSDDVVKRLVSAGGAKFNVSTELKRVLIDATYEYIDGHRDEYNPGKIDKYVRGKIVQSIERFIDLLGCAGKA